jgi:urease accessory protein UreH
VTLVDEVLVCRCVSNQADHVRKVFIKMWQALRPPLLSCPAVLPRIWAT